MAFSKAGHYTDPLIDTLGKPQKNVTVTVYTRGTTNLATLWTSRLKETQASNPTSSDANGNLSFYADPGEYDLKISTHPVIPITVPLDPGEVDEEVGNPLGDAATSDNTWSGINDFDAAVRFKTKPFVDVTHPDFGAVGNGTTDDTTAIQAALTAAEGAICFFPEPTSSYLITATLNISSNTIVCGAGRGALIKAGADFGNNALFRNLTTAPASDAARDTGIVIENLRLDGNRANNSTGTEFSHGVNLTAVTKSVVRNCWIDSCKGDGIIFNATSTRVSEDVQATGNVINDVSRNGIAFTAGKRVTIADNHVTNVVSFFGIDIEPDPGGTYQDVSILGNLVSNCARGIQVGGSFSASNKRVIVHDNHVDTITNATFGRGIYIAGADGTIVSNNYVEGTSLYGIDCPRDKVSIIGNGVRNCGTYLIRCQGDHLIVAGNLLEPSGTQRSIQVESSTVAATISNNVSVATTATTHIRTDDAKDISILNNVISGPAAGAGNGTGITVIRSSANGTDHLIQGNRCRLLEFGIQTGSGTSNNIVQANDVRDTNAFGSAILNQGSGNKVRDNLGFNPQGTASIAVGASPFTYTAGDTPEAVYISGGTVSSIAKNSRTIFTASPATVYLEPGEAVVVTYSAAPTMEKDRK